MHDTDAYFVPPLRMVKLSFLRQVLAGTKLMLKKAQVKWISKVEHFPELSISNVIEHSRVNLPEVLRYLPDDLTPGAVDRSYLLTVD